MVEIKESFKDRLEQALQYREMIPADLAKKTGISEATISQYRSGYSKPKDKRLVMIANVLRVDPSWLMGLDVPMIPLDHKLQELAEDKHDTDMLLKYFGMLNDKGRELALVYVKSLSDMKDFQKESSLQTSTA